MKIKNRYFILSMIIMGIILLISARCKKDSDNATIIKDVDGNNYHTKSIGTQVWMIENLKTKRYNSGEQIPNITDESDWSAITKGAYCDYNNDTNNALIYGRLYNWYAVNDPRGLAPKGWHIATDNDWAILVEYLGGDSVAGGKMKESGTKHWVSSNNEVTNESGFTALPGGLRFFTVGDEFQAIGHTGAWWTHSEDSSKFVYWFMFSTNKRINRVEGIGPSDKNIGLSIRCVKD